MVKKGPFAFRFLGFKTDRFALLKKKTIFEPFFSMLIPVTFFFLFSRTEQNPFVGSLRLPPSALEEQDV